MPARKSESRKSDVSMARFALKDDSQDQPQAASSSSPQQHASQPAPAASASASAEPAATTESQQNDTSMVQDKKDGKDKDATAIEDLSLPKSIITRLAKGVLPANTQIQANAVLAMSKSTTVFINYLASYANEHTTNAGKKTIAPADVFKALEDTEFGFLKERLEAEFSKFNAIQTEKRTSYRNKVKAAKQDGTTGPDTSMADDSTIAANTTAASMDDHDASTAAPRAKKQRVDPSAPGGGDEMDDAETEEEDDDHDDDEEAQNDEEDEEDDEAEGSGDETQDALEERDAERAGEERDEALDGDESD